MDRFVTVLYAVPEYAVEIYSCRAPSASHTVIEITNHVKIIKYSLIYS